MPFPFETLQPQSFARHAWLCCGVTLSGLAPYDKLLLLLLLQMDPLAKGIRLSWRELAAQTKLSPSSCRRATERLELLQLVSVQHQYKEHQEPDPSIFYHLLQREDNLWFHPPNQPLFQSEFLDMFLDMRAGFEEALKTRIEEIHAEKGSKWKKQGRASSHSPRPWRQTFGPFSQEGNALRSLPLYETGGKNAMSQTYIQATIGDWLRQMLPQATEEQILQVTPQHCSNWLYRPR